MDTQAATHQGVDRAALRVVLLSSLGGALEFYDFVVFGVFGVYISAAFFPSGDPATSQLSGLALFGAGYLARPLGGLLFGRRGDRSGRRGSFMLSLGIMSAATVAMGLVPAYATGGLASTILFVVLRLVQGFCLGGELPGAITYAVEVVPRQHATLACGLVFGCVSCGVLLATATAEALNWVLDSQSVAAWGWRIAFVIGGALGGVSWLLRRSLEESPAFLRMQARLRLDEAVGSARGPLAELLANHRHRLLIGIAATGVVTTFNGLLIAHMNGYLIRVLHYAGPEVFAALKIASAVTAVTLVAATWVGDRWTPLGVYRIGCIVLVLAAFPAYGVIAAHGMPLGQVFFLIGLSACFTHGTFALLLADLFPTRIRFSGVALSMNLGAVIFTSLSPLLAATLVAWTSWPPAPAVLIVGTALLALVGTFFLPRLSGQLDDQRSGNDDTERSARTASAAEART